MEFCCALIVPNLDALRQELALAKDAPLTDNAEAKKLIKREIDAVNKTLAPFEIVKKFALLENTFSIESGELTPSLKVKRKVVKERYAALIAELRG